MFDCYHLEEACSIQMRDRKGMNLEGKGGGGGYSRNRERGNYSGDILYEKIIYFQIKEKGEKRK